MSASFADRSIGEIAATLPGATAVFRRHRLDFCCGGQASLAEAAGRREAPLPEIEAALTALRPADAALPQSTAALIDLIEQRYHAAHRQDLPELIALASRVDSVHGGRADAPRGLTGLLMALEIDLQQHMAKEEQVLFPMMRGGGNPMIAHPILVMRHEHDDHAVYLGEIHRLTQGGVPPEGACNTWRALYAGTRKFLGDMAEHVHIENNLLFPRFGA